MRENRDYTLRSWFSAPHLHPMPLGQLGEARRESNRGMASGESDPEKRAVSAASLRGQKM